MTGTVDTVVATTEKIAETIHKGMPTLLSFAEIVVALYPVTAPLILGLKLGDRLDLALAAACHEFLINNGMDADSAVTSIAMHLNPRLPNSPVLSGKPTDAPSVTSITPATP